jgi:hypothetical protein
MAKALKAQKKAEQQEFDNYKKAQSDHKKLFSETQALEKKIAQVISRKHRISSKSLGTLGHS